MDQYLFDKSVNSCKEAIEPTSYLEITSTSEVIHKPLAQEDIIDFLSTKGKFAPHPPQGSRRPALRLILQENIQNPEAFQTNILTVPRTIYSTIIKRFHLPTRSLEDSCPRFWAGLSLEPEDEGPHLQIIFRKSTREYTFEKKNAPTRHWELLLSYSFKYGLTTGLYRGTTNSAMGDCIEHLKASADQFEHPLLLPVIILSHGNPDMVSKAQQNAQQRLGNIERALKSHPKLPGEQPHEYYFDSDGLLNLDYINIALSECHQLVICKDPNAYLRVLDGIEFAIGIFNQHALRNHVREGLQLQNAEFEATAAEIESRIGFSRRRLEGQAAFREVILQRLDVLRSALSIQCGQIDNRVAFQLASAQTKLAFSGRREAAAQKTIAILGAFFLPGAYVSSLFSMTFFNWQTSDSPSESHVSPLFWIYWAISIPFTALVLGSYWWWDHIQSKRAQREDELIEMQMIEMKRRSQNQAALRAPLADVSDGV